MDIETKHISAYPLPINHPKLEDYEKFGWKHTEDVSERYGRSYQNKHVLARDKDMPNYPLIVALEERYMLGVTKRKVYIPINSPGSDYVLRLLILTLLLVFPLIIYLVFKGNQKKRYREYNEAIQTEIDGYAEEAAPLLV